MLWIRGTIVNRVCPSFFLIEGSPLIKYFELRIMNGSESGYETSGGEVLEPINRRKERQEVKLQFIFVRKPLFH